jgi:hypothetical protein
MYTVNNLRRRSSKDTVKTKVPPGAKARMHLGMSAV